MLLKNNKTVPCTDKATLSALRCELAWRELPQADWKDVKLGMVMGAFGDLKRDALVDLAATAIAMDPRPGWVEEILSS